MEYGFSILMFCFSGGILLYAGMIALFGVELIPRYWMVKMTDKKAYARRFARILGVTALAPALSGVVALIVGIEEAPLLPLLALLLGIPAAIWLGTLITKEVE